MNDLVYSLKNGSGLISLYKPQPNPDLVTETLKLCCLEAQECEIHLFVIPYSTFLGKILIFYKTFCEEKGKKLHLKCADQKILKYIKSLSMDQFMLVDLME
ncbi:MAG: hypothetical protein PHH83_04860 [Patescibacteria group bacterium]|nr:hypothetical protein [Patescibacteria group bacterium]